MVGGKLFHFVLLWVVESGFYKLVFDTRPNVPHPATVLVLPKQFLGKGHAGGFAIPLSAVRGRNFESSPTLCEGHRGIFHIHQ